MWSVFLALLFWLMLTPRAALAWGPVTHLTHGAQALAEATSVGVGLQRLLRKHRLSYLYGCVGADITQAKAFTRAQQAHCHSWQVGWSLLDQAASDAQRAFAWGYLTHLASDVLSHNHYVPTQLVVSYRTVAHGHVYWEARFDALQDPLRRDLISEIRRQSFRECDALVREVVSRTIFPFEMDKRIFNSFIAVHDLAQWNVIMKRLIASSRYAVRPEMVTSYNGACYSAIIDLMANGRRAANQNSDPTGLVALTLAGELRSTLRRLARLGRVTPRLEAAIAELDVRHDLSALITLPCYSAPAALSDLREPEAGPDTSLVPS